MASVQQPDVRDQPKRCTRQSAQVFAERLGRSVANNRKGSMVHAMVSSSREAVDNRRWHWAYRCGLEVGQGRRSSTLRASKVQIQMIGVDDGKAARHEDGVTQLDLQRARRLALAGT